MAKLSLFERRRRRVRTALRARAGGKPRLSVHRTGRHIYAQIIDDATGRLMALRFAPAETTRAYVETLRDHVLAHGIPLAFQAVRKRIVEHGSEVRAAVDGGSGRISARLGRFRALGRPLVASLPPCSTPLDAQFPPFRPPQAQ